MSTVLRLSSLHFKGSDSDVSSDTEDSGAEYRGGGEVRYGPLDDGVTTPGGAHRAHTGAQGHTRDHMGTGHTKGHTGAHMGTLGSTHRAHTQGTHRITVRGTSA